MALVHIAIDVMFISITQDTNKVVEKITAPIIIDTKMLRKILFHGDLSCLNIIYISI